MPLKEGYLAKLKSYPADEIKVVVTRTAHSVLAPSKGLLDLVKAKKIDWEAYEITYWREIMGNPDAMAKLREILLLLKEGKTVRLICYEKNPPCHRFILMKELNLMLEEM